MTALARVDLESPRERQRLEQLFATNPIEVLVAIAQAVLDTDSLNVTCAIRVSDGKFAAVDMERDTATPIPIELVPPKIAETLRREVIRRRQ